MRGAGLRDIAQELEKKMETQMGTGIIARYFFGNIGVSSVAESQHQDPKGKKDISQNQALTNISQEPFANSLKREEKTAVRRRGEI